MILNKFLKNIIFGFFGQFTMLAMGVIIPRFVLLSYGSETNGLITTVAQIFAYVALLEAGIGNAAVNAFYKPIVDNDKDKISYVFNAAKGYYRKVTFLYFLCVILFTFLYPMVVSSDIPSKTIMIVVLLQGLSGVVTFYYTETYKQLLIADGKNYVIVNIRLVMYIMSSSAKIIMMFYGYDIITLQFYSFILSCVESLSYNGYVKNKYPWISNIKVTDFEILKERSAFVVHEVSSTIFSCTDALVLSIFCNLKIASVYIIYNMVFHSLNSLVSSVNNGLIYILGQTFVKSKNKYVFVHDLYDGIYMSLYFAVFSVAYILVNPFVRLYTRGIKDINYLDNYLPILFVFVQLLSCIRAVSSRLITISGHAENTKIRSVIETLINLMCSIILVQFIGIYGVLMGTIIALLYRSNDIIIYANRYILQRSLWITYKKVIINFALFIVIVFLNYKYGHELDYICNSYVSIVCTGVILTIAFVSIYIIGLLIFDRAFKNWIVNKLYVYIKG